MKTVLIFGAKGNLGCDLTRVFLAAGWHVLAYDRDRIDVTEPWAVRVAIKDAKPDVVINAAAWNNVDAAEDPANLELVTKLNALAPGYCAEVAAEVGATFVHYSTDYVFAGTKPEGYRESDEPDAVSVYGRSKADGERAARAHGGNCFVVRTSKLYGTPGSSVAAKPSFVSVMCRLAAEKPELSIVDEEVGMPTYTFDLATATLALVSGTHEPGTYHLVNDGPGVTWYGFAEEFFALRGITTPRKPVPQSAFPRPAARPTHAQLLNTKFPPLPARIDALRRFFAEAHAVAE